MSSEMTVIDAKATELARPADVDVSVVKQRYQAIVELQRDVMTQGVDYDKIGRSDRNTLLKPGAEKLAILFGLRVSYEAVKTIEDWEKGFFYYHYKAILRNGAGDVVGEGEGSCNTREKKYRWSWVQRVEKPEEDEANRLKAQGLGKWKPVWVRTHGQSSKQWKFFDRVENPDVYDLVNTVQKMAQKRALVAAVLVTVGASELFTQDLEDFEDRVGADTAEVVEVEVDEAPEQTGPVDYSSDPDWKKISARFHAMTKGDLQADFKCAIKSMLGVISTKHIKAGDLQAIVAKLSHRQKHGGDAGVVEAMEKMIAQYGGVSEFAQ